MANETDLKNTLSQSDNYSSNDPDTGTVLLTPFLAGLYLLENESDIDSYTSKFEFLSPQVSKILFDSSSAEFIEDRLGKKFNLDNNQKEAVANLIRGILMGDVFIGDFTNEFKNKLQIDQAKAEEISNVIVSELLPPAIESMKRIQKIKFPNRIQDLIKNQAAKPPTNIPFQENKPATSTQQPKQGSGIPPQSQPNQSQPAKTPTSSSESNQAPQQSRPPTSIQIPPPIQTKPPQATTQLPQNQNPQRPPLTIPPRPSTPQPSMPSINSQPRPSIQQPQINNSAPSKPLDAIQNRPPIPRPEFKTPPPLNLNTTPVRRPEPSQSSSQNQAAKQPEANKSLEDELEKVASVIDLRDQNIE